MSAKWVEPLLWCGLFLMTAGSSSISLAQNQDDSRMPMNGMRQEDGDRMDRESPEMREMAKAMKSMADMCQMMMQGEMRFRPYWITTGIVAGVLLTIALVLFVVLEVQWIRFWHVRIKTERKKLE